MKSLGYTPDGEAASPDLDAVFMALADPVRRGILVRLTDGPATVSELADPLPISQPAVSRHLKVLQRAGLITREIDRQRRPARLDARSLAAATAWLGEFRRFWQGSFDQLDTLLTDLQTKSEDTP